MCYGRSLGSFSHSDQQNQNGRVGGTECGIGRKQLLYLNTSYQPGNFLVRANAIKQSLA
jgi:hypothetical protein